MNIERSERIFSLFLVFAQYPLMTHFARRPTTAKSNCILSYLAIQLYAFYRNLEKTIIHFIVIQIIVTILAARI